MSIEKNIYENWLKADEDKTMESGRRIPLEFKSEQKPVVIKKKENKAEKLQK